ncbi:MAG TPA: hypothetical protein EYH07_16215 [Kiloniellaceae bacterium]|nr:hypothetical protein [Kiloniellaceae bacterium]
MKNGADSLRWVSDLMRAQRTRQREAVRDALKVAPIPIPQVIVDELALLNPTDALDVLKDHPGFKIWQRWKSYQAALALFERCMADLFAAIDAFDEVMRQDDLFSASQRHKREEGSLRVHKELFAAGNAAHSLRDHASYRLQDIVQNPEFKARLAEHFGDDGLHDFVIALRTITHHIEMVEPALRITHRFGGNAAEITFYLDRDKLQAAVESVKQESGKYKINEAGRRYLKDALATIDVKAIYEEYLVRASAFHSWFSGTLEAGPPLDLQDFERCLKANGDMAARTMWKALLGNWLNWDKPPNPYDHLPRLLTGAQLEEVMRLPRKSEQQVDRVIAFLDKDGACDDEFAARHI